MKTRIEVEVFIMIPINTTINKGSDGCISNKANLITCERKEEPVQWKIIDSAYDSQSGQGLWSNEQFVSALKRVTNLKLQCTSPQQKRRAKYL